MWWNESWIWTIRDASELLDVGWSVEACVLMDNKYVNIASMECISLIYNFAVLEPTFPGIKCIWL